MKPNIILFTTDQQRGDHISISGHPVVETPNVDSFVNCGAYFPNAYTGKELFFDLKKDRQEIHNLSKNSAYAQRVKVWRKRLVDLLAERNDGFSDGKKLLLKKKRWSPVAEENISKRERQK